MFGSNNLGRGVVAVLPAGYCKSITFHLLPWLLHEKINSRQPAPSPPFGPIIIVVSPLNALIKHQIRQSSEGRVKATFLNSKRKSR